MALKGLYKTWEAYFIKWTTSGEPLEGLKSHQDSKCSHSKVILYIAHCMSVKEMSLYFLGGVPIQYFKLDPIDPWSSYVYLNSLLISHFFQFIKQ